MTCFLFRQRSLDVSAGNSIPDMVYIAVSNGALIDTYAPRFAETYRQFPPGHPHHLIVICNGGPLSNHRRKYFNSLDCQFLERQNDAGWDISAYQAAAASSRSDFLVCLGESVYFHRAGWLSRIMEAKARFGPGMYGCFSSHIARAHLNTTAFACGPDLLAKYPPVTNHDERYEFEHGQHSFWRRVAASNLAAILVTWDGCWGPTQWRIPPNILYRGTQENCLVYCNHTSRYQSADARTKQVMASNADQGFQ